MYDEHAKELTNIENIMADTTDGKITANATNNFTLCEDISMAILKDQGLLNDEIVESRLEEILQQVNQYQNCAPS